MDDSGYHSKPIHHRQDIHIDPEINTNHKRDVIHDTSTSTCSIGKPVNYWSSTTVFITQVSIIYIVIVCSLINLTFYPKNRQELWITLLSSSVGYLLPSPRIKKQSAEQNDE